MSSANRNQGEAVGRKKNKDYKKTKYIAVCSAMLLVVSMYFKGLLFPDHYDLIFQLKSSSERFQLRRVLNFFWWVLYGYIEF